MSVQTSTDQIAERLQRVRDRIAAQGVDPATIQIVAVTKFHDAATCRAAVAAGLTTLGENRVQEALSKMDQVPGAEWHLIGHLQTNKVRSAARFAMIQSLDSTRLAVALAERAPEVPVLVEVNVSGDQEKSGVAPEEALDLVVQAAPRLSVRGLMGMGPRDGDPRPAFRLLRELRERAQDRLGRPLPVLSMGMTQDFESAVGEGSTMLRLGTVLFGPRG
ncbi:MAG: YggS family pyridoxal phosphate-dependent enzyme [Candidatus Dormibacteraeota bacterium]|nr:YggS family pyridoxal phosphate-dependent enzyme [Candidatus Dormibacteraeota bacterium]MBO0744545.1 YggS family pyridoxal phosphate-dependent enzyme [Candidatus Dormibacteraeota bacterium]